MRELRARNGGFGTSLLASLNYRLQRSSQLGRVCGRGDGERDAIADRRRDGSADHFAEDVDDDLGEVSYGVGGRQNLTPADGQTERPVSKQSLLSTHA